MKKLLLSLGLLWVSVANAQFSPGQLLTAGALNSQFSLYSKLSGATFTGPLTVPTLNTSNAAITGGTITGLSAPIPVASGGTGANTATGATGQLQYLQGATGSVARSVTSKLQDAVSVLDFGAACNGSGNDGPTIQSAITAVSVAGGGIVQIPASTCRTTQTLTITSSNVTLQGQNARGSIIACATGASDCIDITGASAASQIYGNFIRDIRITQSGVTGSLVAVRFAAQGGLERLVIDSPTTVTSLSGINDFRLRDVYFFMSASATAPALKWFSAVTGERSDVLTLDHVTVNQNGSGQDCMAWDGNTQTLRIFGVNMLGCAKGLHIQNTSGSTSVYPQFLQADDLEIDSASSNALISDSYAASLTVVNSQLTSGSGVPAVDIGANTDRVYIVGSRLQGSYGLQVEAGATHVIAVGNDFNSNATGAVNDLSGNAVVQTGIDFNGGSLGALNAKISGHLAFSGSAPALSSCGTSPSINGTDAKGQVATGTGTVNSCTVTFSKAYTSNPVCVANGSNTAFSVAPTSISTTAVTFGFSTSVPSTGFYYHCMQ